MTLKPPKEQQDNTLPSSVLNIGRELHWPKYFFPTFDKNP